MPDPSSPGLPSLPGLVDSGFMSGGAFDSFRDEDDKPMDLDDLDMTLQNPPRPSLTTMQSDISFIEQTPGPPELLPTRIISNKSTRPSQEPSAMSEAEVSQRKAANSAACRRDSLAAHQRQSQIDSYESDAQFQKPAMTRGDSIANSMRSMVNSPVPTDEYIMTSRPPPLPRSGSGAKRKKVIQEKLMQSIANGIMPNFCAHCGAIETPTWRSLHVKTVDGSPDDDEGADVEGTTMGVEVMARDAESDKVTKYRIIKSVRKSRDRVEMQGYETMSVCNRKSTSALMSSND